MQVMLTVDGTGKSDGLHVSGWEGLDVSSTTADRGDVAPTDLVVSVNLRWGKNLSRPCAHMCHCTAAAVTVARSPGWLSTWISFKLCRDERLEGMFNYSTDLFTATTMERMAQHCTTLLQSIIASPAVHISKLRVMPRAEEQLVLHTFNDNAGTLPALCMHQLFERQAAATPAAQCLIDGHSGASLSFAEVNASANRLAHHLAASGVAAEVPVAVMMDKCFELYIALIAIQKAGGCYVPIDPTMPAARLCSIIEQAGVQLLIIHPGIDGIWPHLPPTLDVLVCDEQWQQFSSLPAIDSGTHSNVHSLAYVVFTSGSTGKPKGIAIEHIGDACSGCR